MALKCDACGSEDAHRIRYYGDGSSACDRCGASPTQGVPDVYWDGKPEENLADDPVTGKPRVFLSKGHKAAYLKERGLMEAGDRVRGAPYMPGIPAKTDSKHEVRMALKQVREMGQDVRRQAYLRIIKEGQHHAINQ